MLKQKARRVVTVAAMLIPALYLMAPHVSAQTTYKIGIATVTGSQLRLRESANLFSNVIDHAEKGDIVVVLEKDGDWYKVNYNTQEGYMHEDYLNFVDRENVELGYGRICGDVVNVRSGPSLTKLVISQVKENDMVYIIGINNGWYKVIVDEQVGYIRSDYVELTEIPYENADSQKEPLFFVDGKLFVDNVDVTKLTEAKPLPEKEDLVPDVEVKTDEEMKQDREDAEQNLPESGVTPDVIVEDATEDTTEKPNDEVVEDTEDIPDETPEAGMNDFGNLVVTTAQKYLGVPYVWGGKSPSGFDCSGFVYYVFNQAGYPLSRSMTYQYKAGTPVSKDELQPGDIVFFQNTYTTGMSHVGIYTGNGMFIHAPSTGKTVSYADLNSSYYVNHWYGAVRITPDP